MVHDSNSIEEVRIKNDEGGKITRVEKYWLGRNVNVRREAVPFAMNPTEQLEFMKCKLGIDINDMPMVSPKQKLKQTGINYFAENYCKLKRANGSIGKIKTRDYQADALDNMVNKRFNLLFWSRQSAKSVSAAIFILWFVTFNNEKNVAVIANLDTTRKEIVEKIKVIYYELPFFLKVGCSSWNDGSITFKDTKCRLKSYTAGPTSSAGFTADVVFMDEFDLVEESIARDFYGSAYPTIAAMPASKVIICSTPRKIGGIFYTILTDSRRPKGDIKKNQFHSSTVYWWQVKDEQGNFSRLRSYLRVINAKLDELNITIDDIEQWLIAHELNYIKEWNTGEQRYEFHIDNYTDKLPAILVEMQKEYEGKNFLSDWLRRQALSETVKLIDVVEISSWREDQVSNIGEELFEREFDLLFTSSDASLFDSQMMSKFVNEIKPFDYQKIDKISDNSYVKYDNLKWIDDGSFLLSQAKDAFIVLGVDIGEGLGGDNSCINIFQLRVKPEEQWGKQVKTIFELFQLVQIGIYRFNYISVPELAELLYLISFEIFDDNKLGVVLEMNAFGGELLLKMREMNQGRNKFSNHIFFRYKHRIDAVTTDIGIKLRQQKNLYVKEYQKRLKISDIILHDSDTINEVASFSKKKTKAGNVVFEAISGKDDAVMTVVEVSTVFEHFYFQDLCNRMMEKLPENLTKKMNEKVGLNPIISGIDYSVFNAASKRANSMREFKMNQNNVWNDIERFKRGF